MTPDPPPRPQLLGLAKATAVTSALCTARQMRATATRWAVTCGRVWLQYFHRRVSRCCGKLFYFWQMCFILGVLWIIDSIASHIIPLNWFERRSLDLDCLQQSACRLLCVGQEQSSRSTPRFQDVRVHVQSACGSLWENIKTKRTVFPSCCKVPRLEITIKRWIILWAVRHPLEMGFFKRTYYRENKCNMLSVDILQMHSVTFCNFTPNLIYKDPLDRDKKQRPSVQIWCMSLSISISPCFLSSLHWWLPLKYLKCLFFKVPWEVANTKLLFLFFS